MGDLRSIVGLWREIWGKSVLDETKKTIRDEVDERELEHLDEEDDILDEPKEDDDVDEECLDEPELDEREEVEPREEHKQEEDEK